MIANKHIYVFLWTTFLAEINIFRQLIIIVGLMFLISIITHNLSAVWFAIPLSEFISCGMAIGFENKMMKDMK